MVLCATVVVSLKWLPVPIMTSEKKTTQEGKLKTSNNGQFEQLYHASSCSPMFRIAWEVPVHFSSIWGWPFQQGVANAANHWHIFPNRQCGKSYICRRESMGLSSTIFRHWLAEIILENTKVVTHRKVHRWLFWFIINVWKVGRFS